VGNSQLAGCVVLVVEDEPLVCLEVVETLTACGARAVPACKIADAIWALDQHPITAALLDVNVGGEDCSVPL
jgi:DNA-binding response OmpR family regulator